MSVLPQISAAVTCLNVCGIYQDCVKAQEQASTKDGEIKALKKENRKRRKIIEAYQDMLNAGATGLHTVYTSIG